MKKQTVSKIKKYAAEGFLSALIFISSISLCVFLRFINNGIEYASMLFVLAVFLISRITTGYTFGILFSVLGVLAVNFFFTYPFFKFQFLLPGYPITIISMLAVSVITSTLTTRIKQQEKEKLEAEKEKTRSNLLRAISHDIRTPLTSIIGASSAILENKSAIDEEQIKSLVGGINEDANWLIRMVENLLSITRIDSDNKAEIKKQTAICEEVMAGALAKFRKRFPDVCVKASIPEEVIFADMDAMLIEQVIINLLENAVIHSKTTLIRLSLYKENGWAVFSVQDNGSGIDSNILPYIFKGNKKYVSYMENDTKKNMGIGLSVCDTIIKAHNGTIHAENLQKGGAVFRFNLPLKEALYEQ